MRLFLQEKIDYNSIIGNILNLIKDKKFKKYAIHPTTKLSKIYFLDQLPSEINFYSIFIISVISIIISAIASYLPAIRISKISTFRALRYE